MSYVFHPASEAEHLETVGYLETKRAGLGASYLADFEATMTRVCEAPERNPAVATSGVRRASFNHFPYSVLYRSIDGIVQVLAVAHHRRRPSYWLGRV